MALIAFIGAAIGIASTVALLEPIAEGDLLAIWALKAEVLVHEPVSRSAYFTDLSKAYSHLDYPLLWPFAMAWLWASMCEIDLVAVKVLAPALLVSFATAFYGIVSRAGAVGGERTGLRGHALLFTALLIGTPMMLAQAERLSADAALAFLATLAFGHARLWLDSAHADDLRLAGLFIAGVLFTKNEGAVLAAALVTALAIELLRERSRKRLGEMLRWLVAMPLAATVPWFVFRATLPNVHESYGARIWPSVFVENLSRVPEVLDAAPSYFGSTADWIIFWPLAGSVLLMSVLAPIERASRFLILGVALVLLAYGYIYVVTPWNLRALMDVSANRLLLQVFGICVLFVAEATMGKAQ